MMTILTSCTLLISDIRYFIEGNLLQRSHDLTPLLFKTGKASTKNPLIYGIKHFFFKHILRSQIENAVSIITPTKTVKNQIIQVYGSHLKDKIIPLHEGIGYELAQTKENESLKFRYQKPFFIYVGNFYPHKNIKRLVEAFTGVMTWHQLILIGPRDYFATSILQYIRQCNIEARIIIVDNATTPDLVFFYKHAQALIHPSLSEGFGLPSLKPPILIFLSLPPTFPFFKNSSRVDTSHLIPMIPRTFKIKLQTSFPIHSMQIMDQY